MPQAIERLLATPMIRPRLPRIKPELSGMTLPVLGRAQPAVSYGIGAKTHQAMPTQARPAFVKPVVSGNILQIQGFSLAIGTWKSAGPAGQRGWLRAGRAVQSQSGGRIG